MILTVPVSIAMFLKIVFIKALLFLIIFIAISYGNDFNCTCIYSDVFKDCIH
nr:MAG TPA: hypothetical protein [Inoviridae sp.]